MFAGTIVGWLLPQPGLDLVEIMQRVGKLTSCVDEGL
jgi:hypothetical protein